MTNKFFTEEGAIYTQVAILSTIVWLYREVIRLYCDKEHPWTLNDKPMNMKAEEGLGVATEVRVGVCCVGGKVVSRDVGENDGSILGKEYGKGLGESVRMS